MLANQHLLNSVWLHKWAAYLAGAVEYTNCISAEGEDPLNECPGYNIKTFDGEAPAMKIWGMWSTPFCHCSQPHSGPEW